MKYGEMNHFQTGVAIPISGLKSDQSCGIGEFYDLVPFAQWAKNCGMDLIQILPINDSGAGSSPYSALSAFAINPIYLRLEKLPGTQKYLAKIRSFREKQSHLARIPYYEVYQFKQELFKKAFAEGVDEAEIKKVEAWIKKNAWIKPYAAYLYFKQSYGNKAWHQWPENRLGKDSLIKKVWKDNKDEMLFHAWLQYHCELQFKESVESLNKIGMNLKGDIPILINEDSVDVWAHPEIFEQRFKAGAPPDMFSTTGQNWGFPCYNWAELEKQDFAWWKDRMKQCAKFFHAIRIDHVLGFFRIWRVPLSEHEGILGSFFPALNLSEKSLFEKGFSAELFKQMVHPTLSEQQAQQFLAPHLQDWGTLFEFKDGLCLLKEEYCNESALKNLAGDNKDLHKVLKEIYWNRLLVADGSGNWQPYWYWYQTPTYQRLNDWEKQSFGDLIHDLEHRQDSLWSVEGSKLLKMLKESSDMLVCAEDLGSIPPCVPEVLGNLDILSLKIERWARYWDREGQPFIPMNEYPRLSVCSPSCHDTTTLRGWWDEKFPEQRTILDLLGWQEGPDFLTIELAEAIIRRNLSANSLVVIFPLQDWLALTYEMRTMGSDEERINIPGTVTDFNWTWKMKPSLSELETNEWLKSKIFGLINERKTHAL